MTFRSMADAPRDGTIVEIECTYGIRPWYDIMAWRNDRWESVSQPGNSLGSETSAGWRPYKGDASHYVDPTGGLQFRGEYWGGSPGDMRGGGASIAPGQSITVKKDIPFSYFEDDGQVKGTELPTEEAQQKMQATPEIKPETGNAWLPLGLLVMLVVGLTIIIGWLSYN